jgi:poly-gamma-glutamate capsule biosynthesis protein CapA/YwtB (metallophosphatase superfamily)
LGNIMDKKNLKKLKTKDWIGNSLSVIYEKGENEKRAQSVYLVSFGDIMLGRDVRSLMNAYGLNYPFSQMDPFYLKSNDILLGNLEGPIAKNAVKTKKTIAFRFLPDIAPILKNNYFDALSMANNHSFDMGLQGFEDTAEILAAQGIVHFGDPRGIGDGSVAEISVNGTNIAFLGLEEVIYKINDDKAVEKIKELYSQGYKVIPVVHWGVEYQHKPNARQKDLAHKFIDAGAIMVIGHHPHVVESFEEYNGHPIFYSLGNAVFDQYFSADTQEGLSIALNIKSNSIETFLFPIKIDRSRMRLMADDEKNEFLKRFVGYGTGYSEEQKSALLGGRIESKF